MIQDSLYEGIFLSVMAHIMHIDHHIHGFPYFLMQFFGGTNFGRTSGGPNYITSYDYDAPLDEYGRLKCTQIR